MNHLSGLTLPDDWRAAVPAGWLAVATVYVESILNEAKDALRYKAEKDASNAAAAAIHAAGNAAASGI